MRRTFLLSLSIVVVVAFAIVPAFAQASLNVTVQATPGAQLQLARTLIGKAITVPAERMDDRRSAVMLAVANLRAIGRTWPNEKDAIAEATVLEADLLSAPSVRAYPTAEEVARRGLANFEKTARGAILHRILGQTLQAEGRTHEAEQAFASAEHHPKMQELSAIDQLKIWQASEYFYDSAGKNPREAAKRARAASHVRGLPAMTYLNLTLQSIERAADADPDAARGDLRELDRLLAETRKSTVTNPADLAALKSYDAAATKYHKKLG